MNETFQQPGRWHDIVLTPITRSPPPTHVMAFTLRDLQSGSTYEAIIQAKNRFGWNEVIFVYILLSIYVPNSTILYNIEWILVDLFIYVTI